ncbi:MAG: redox-regulated ATPase YchF [Bacteroidales bacterium]|nr:redox-regulated ATPase YchF [Bacteroidales bacterium]MCF8350746.1 redox-regulated ATPase YchF [Bacteroidales bacterium]MCF8377915.1 redox-regulated ATPase YchF [Bacteroidales bacterium]
MSLNCGIIGLANTGKTTIFNCMAVKKAEASNYAFGAAKSNISIINVPDPRLHEINKYIKSDRIVPATVEIVDIPGLTKGSSRGEGVGNKFLADIQKTDALIHVLRCFEDENLPHIEGSVNPVRDKEIVDLELQIRDLDLVERKIARSEKIAQHGDKQAQKEIGILSVFKEQLENFQNIRDLDIDENERESIKDLYLLTDKPVIYVCNVDEESAINGNQFTEKAMEVIRAENAEVLIIAGELEAEITELEDEADRKAFLKDYKLEEPGVNKLIRSAYKTLNLQSFFTAGPKEVRAWTIRKGMNAQQAAGVIHSDMERGFIRAEVMKYEDFIGLKSEQAVKDAGKMRLEGKSYIVQEGDIMHIRFNV